MTGQDQSLHAVGWAWGWTLEGVVGSVAAEPERRTTSRAPPKLRWALFLGSVVFWGLGGRVLDVV